MKKKTKNNNLEKMNIATVSIINNNKEDKKETNKNDKKVINKSKSTNKAITKLEGIKQTAEIKIDKNPTTFNLDFIFRREHYTLKNILSNYLLSRVKKLISKKISVDLNLIHVYYLDKEITNDKINVYDLIKNKAIKFLEIKKASPINENIISLNSNANLIYKVKCKNIETAKDFIDKIELFFRDKCLDNHYLCEPVGINEYDVGFCCEDTCYQFKRYMNIVKKLDPNYSQTTFEYVSFEKKKVLIPRLSNFRTISNSSESLFINKGPYMTYEDIQKKNEKEGKTKWISKKGFIFKKPK